MSLPPPSPPTAAPPDLGALMSGSLRLTPATVAVVAANLGVFVVMLFFGAGLWHAQTEVQLAWGANFGPATQDGAWWRLATAMFLHFGLLHLAMNLWALWDAGRLVERLFGSGRFLLLYLGSGIAGNLVSLVVQGNQAVSGGASGAIFGVYGALLVCLARERRRLDPHEFRWLFGGAAVFAVATLALGQWVRGIDNAAHAGGLLSGALLGAMLLRPLPAAPPFALHRRGLAAAALATGITVLLLKIPEPRYRFGEELEARAAIRSFGDEERRLGARWRSLLQGAAAEGESFETLATRIDEDIARDYRDSFEQLSALNLDPDAPSAPTVERLRRYSQQRGEASHALAEALRSQDRERVQAALEALRASSRQAGAPAASASAVAPAAPASR